MFLTISNRFLVFMIKGKLVGNSGSLIVSGELSIALVIVKVRKNIFYNSNILNKLSRDLL